MIRWISVKDKLPKDKNQWVFTCCEDMGHPQSVGVSHCVNGKWYSSEDDEEEIRVDYWMPVPNFNTGKKIYLAAPIDQTSAIRYAKHILEGIGFEVYVPSEHKVDHAWEYPNHEWSLMVFQSDIEAIKASDYVVVISYGRNSTAGTNWEAGYAFGIGKKVIVVEMTEDEDTMSVMVSNGRYATVHGIAGLRNYDWYNMEKSRTNTEQK